MPKAPSPQPSSGPQPTGPGPSPSPAPEPQPAGPSPVQPKQTPPSPQAAQGTPPRSLGVSSGVQRKPQRVGIYGPGGVGKSELASLVATVGLHPLFIDLEEGTGFLDVSRVDPVPETFEELRAAVQMAVGMEGVDAVVFDSLTKAEELAVDYTLRTKKHEKGHYVDSIEGYGFGKGYMHVYESFLLLMQDLDAVVRDGTHVITICHDCTANVPNPAGEDWIRYEPRLQSPPSGRGSIRHRVKEWVDHLIYVGFDVFTSTDGKASGSGTRTCYPIEMPTHWAKSRSLSQPFPYDQGDATLWQSLLT